MARFTADFIPLSGADIFDMSGAMPPHLRVIMDVPNDIDSGMFEYTVGSDKVEAQERFVNQDKLKQFLIERYRNQAQARLAMLRRNKHLGVIDRYTQQIELDDGAMMIYENLWGYEYVTLMFNENLVRELVERATSDNCMMVLFNRGDVTEVAALPMYDLIQWANGKQNAKPKVTYKRQLQQTKIDKLVSVMQLRFTQRRSMVFSALKPAYKNSGFSVEKTNHLMTSDFLTVIDTEMTAAKCTPVMAFKEKSTDIIYTPVGTYRFITERNVLPKFTKQEDAPLKDNYPLAIHPDGTYVYMYSLRGSYYDAVSYWLDQDKYSIPGNGELAEWVDDKWKTEVYNWDTPNEGVHLAITYAGYKGTEKVIHYVTNKAPGVPSTDSNGYAIAYKVDVKGDFPFMHDEIVTDKKAKKVSKAETKYLKFDLKNDVTTVIRHSGFTTHGVTTSADGSNEFWDSIDPNDPKYSKSSFASIATGTYTSASIFSVPPLKEYVLNTELFEITGPVWGAKTFTFAFGKDYDETKFINKAPQERQRTAVTPFTLNGWKIATSFDGPTGYGYGDQVFWDTGLPDTSWTITGTYYGYDTYYDPEPVRKVVLYGFPYGYDEQIFFGKELRDEDIGDEDGEFWTPYGEKATAYKGRMVPWLHLSNGKCVVQGYGFQKVGEEKPEKLHVWFSGKELTKLLTQLLSIEESGKNLLAILIDIQLSDIRKLK